MPFQIVLPPPHPVDGKVLEKSFTIRGLYIIRDKHNTYTDPLKPPNSGFYAPTTFSRNDYYRGPVGLFAACQPACKRVVKVVVPCRKLSIRVLSSLPPGS